MSQTLKIVREYLNDYLQNIDLKWNVSELASFFLALDKLYRAFDTNPLKFIKLLEADELDVLIDEYCESFLDNLSSSSMAEEFRSLFKRIIAAIIEDYKNKPDRKKMERYKQLKEELRQLEHELFIVENK